MSLINKIQSIKSDTVQLPTTLDKIEELEGRLEKLISESLPKSDTSTLDIKAKLIDQAQKQEIVCLKKEIQSLNNELGAITASSRKTEKSKYRSVEIRGELAALEKNLKELTETYKQGFTLCDTLQKIKEAELELLKPNEESIFI